MNDALTEQVFDTIRTMEKEREQAHRAPILVLYRDLYGRVDRVGIDENTLKKALRGLLDAKRIAAGPTLNDWYIRTK